jgi:hypothetical protein
MHSRFASFLRAIRTVAKGLLLLLASSGIAPAFAGCSDRPGTPTEIAVASPRPGTIDITWRDTTRRGEGSCHDIEIKRTRTGDTSASVTGGVCLPGATPGNYVVNSLPYGEEYCVRMRARDHAGTKGCVSERWSATACGVVGTPGFPASIIPTTGTAVADVDLPGNDLAPGFPIGNVDACKLACQNNTHCDAWTFVKGPAPVCWLKSPIPTAVRSPCCVSGEADRPLRAVK